MNYKIVNGSISFGADTILEEINFEIKEKEKIAIVGRNGCGKTTFLKSLIHNDMLEEGIGETKFGVYKQGKIEIGYLEQIQFENEDITMEEEILKVYKDIINQEEKISLLQSKMESNSTEENIKLYTNAIEKYEQMDGYIYKKEYMTAIRKFGFSLEDFKKRVSEFSGGQKTKIALIRLILSKPDLLLLDEPTNHLDIETIEWLEMYLKNYPKAIVIVSHDRMFLDKIVNKVYEIEYGAMTQYSGNYTFYEKQKQINYEKQLQDYEYQQKEIKRIMAIVEKFRYKKNKAKMAQSKLTYLEHMTLVDKPEKFDLNTFSTNFKPNIDSGNLVLSVNNLAFGYDKVISRVSFDLYRGRKLGVIGANGKGKSTLLKTLANNIRKLDGKFEYGYNVEMQYFDQQMESLDRNNTVIEEFSKDFPQLTNTQTRSCLASFMFYADDINKKVDSLSGGEKVRLELCKIMKKGPNLLLLDEPTNHMDIVGKESLEKLLELYTGTIIVVSHDRYFINKIADSLLIFENDKVVFFDGRYDEYLEKKEKEDDDLQVSQVTNSSNVNIVDKTKSNSTYFENKEKNKIKNKIKRIENDIEIMENKINNINEEMQKPENCTSYTKLADLQKEIDQLNSSIDEKMIQWEQLNGSIEE